MRRLLASLVVPALTLTACGGDLNNENISEESLSVVAAFYPLAEVAEQIGGGAVEVTNLTPPGAEPHDIELRSDQLDAVIDADVVLYLGFGFQPALDEAVGRTEGVVLDVLEGQDLMLGEADEHEDETAEEEEAIDPHVWLDPSRWAEVVERIGAAFAEADPSSADSFEAGADVYADELVELDLEFDEDLSACERNVIVTSHAAFGYLAARYGLEQHPISGVSPEAEPDPERLAELADLVKDEGVTTIFTETLLPPDIAETLARETEADVATLNPIEGLTSDQIENGEDYMSVMRENLVALRAGLGCQ